VQGTLRGTITVLINALYKPSQSPHTALTIKLMVHRHGINIDADFVSGCLVLARQHG
jgi:hypothetical protein